MNISVPHENQEKAAKTLNNNLLKEMCHNVARVISGYFDGDYPKIDDCDYALWMNKANANVVWMWFFFERLLSEHEKRFRSIHESNSIRDSLHSKFVNFVKKAKIDDRTKMPNSVNQEKSY